ncbi:hypothetical protein Tco_1160571, partial [Tanacetum coccineum]
MGIRVGLQIGNQYSSLRSRKTDTASFVCASSVVLEYHNWNPIISLEDA